MPWREFLRWLKKANETLEARQGVKAPSYDPIAGEQVNREQMDWLQQARAERDRTL